MNTTAASIKKKKAEDIVDKVVPGGRTVSPLPFNGYLFLEHDVPCLLIYKNISNDAGTIRLARSSASYLIIGDTNPDFFNNVIDDLTKKMSARFGAFVLINIHSGKDREFTIQGPSNKLPVSLLVLQEELEKVPDRDYGVNLKATLKNTGISDYELSDEILNAENIRAKGGTLVDIAIPPVYRDEDGNIFPVYFRKFRDSFTLAIQKSIFEFLRVQTTSKLASYHALGKRDIHREVFKIDRQLTEIESSYPFLLLVAPINITKLRERFFENNFDKIGKYHYRLLPVDPDLLKRKLYDLRIDEIDDPALSYIFDEKREEIDQQLTMLKERGSKNFFYSSMRLYKGIEKNVLSEAKLILRNIAEDHEQKDRKLIDAKSFEKLANEEFDYFRKQAPEYTGKVHIREDVNIMMVSQGELYLPKNYTLTKNGAKALIQHEIGTHALTYFNGQQQPLSQLAAGLADYDALQEGIAVLSEYLIGGLSGNRLRTLAGRVIAGEALLDGADFKQMFDLLYSEHGFSEENAFDITSRMFQGGGFLKDIIYLKGLVELRDYLMDGGELETLLAGKFALKHVDVIKDLTERNLVFPPKLKPRYFEEKNYNKKIEKVKQGLSLTKMI